MNIFKNKSLGQLVANFRNEYISHGIDEGNLASNPIHQFERWLQEAIGSKIAEPNVMHLATSSVDGRPSGRVMLLKGFDESGFVFFSNYESRKGNELTSNPYAAITFL
jgi:pyridoxamine 5'-phosphate oxidase